MNRVATAVVAMLLVAVPAFPCGGPGADLVDLPLVPAKEYLAHTLYDDDYEVELRPELRFLEPFRRLMPDSVVRLYGFLYEGDGRPAELPDDTVRARVRRELLTPAIRAIERGEFLEAAAAARRVVNQVLDMPANVAGAYRDALRSAVEIADVAPRLTASDRSAALSVFTLDVAARQAGSVDTTTSPWRDVMTVRQLSRDSAAAYAERHPESLRLASLRFVALQEAMRTGIPDGWAGSIKDSVPPARWAELERLHTDWLARFGDHPLADYVRLSKVRLFYFEGERDRAWNELLAMYPRHRERVLGEMNYLVRTSVRPQSLDDPRFDWPLRTALLPSTFVTDEQWTAYWKASEAHIREPWAIAMQERLLWRYVELQQRRAPLPAGFPSRARAPSSLWSKLRLVALLQSGDVAGAFEQADSTADTVSDIGAIRVRLRLLRRDWGGALAVAPVGDPATAYLVRVLAPASIVDSLASARRSPFTTDARLTIAARRAAVGDWPGASRSAGATSPARARIWARTATLAADTSRAGRLAFARWMRDRHGALFFGENTFWLRGLNWRLYGLARDTTDRNAPPPRLDPRLPWTPAEERAKIGAHLESTTELYYSLRSYARWLDGATASTPGLAAVVREADQVYNRLVNWDESNSRFWPDVLTDSPEAHSIRRAGLLLRRR